MKRARVALAFCIGPIGLVFACSRSGAQDVPDGQQGARALTIPLLTFSDAHPWRTDLGSNFGVYLGPQERLPQAADDRPSVAQRLEWDNGDPYLSLRFAGLAPPHQFAGLWLSVFGHIRDRDVTLPAEVAHTLTAVRFRARAPEGRVHFRVELKTVTGQVRDRYFDATERWQTLAASVAPDGGGARGGPFLREHVKEVVFVIESALQPGRGMDERNGVLELDDVSLLCEGEQPFVVPAEEGDFLDWLRDRCLHYFIWNYREPGAGRGIVLERNSFHDLVSVAGIGYALPAFIIAEEEGLLDADEARARVANMLRWLGELDCSNGQGGRHGFPYHFLRPDGSRAGGSEAGTIDWAICAAGVRVARQHYKRDSQIQRLTTDLLERPEWEATVGESSRISHGFSAGGELLNAEWGSSFTEEAYLVALEAVASGDLGPGVFAGLEREERSGFWPSWFGSGFTYNWLQLWSGPREPFATNSTRAYEADARFCAERFGRPTMGCTAHETFSRADAKGFLQWDTYAGTAGSDIHLAGEKAIDHRSVCPYGAALALPFIREKAVAALRGYVSLGFVHPMLGLPDSVRLEGLPEGADGPIPNWTQFAIDVGPMWMAIEACGPEGGRIAELYLADDEIESALAMLDESLMGWEEEFDP